MAILPEGFALPPLPYLLALVVAGGLVGYTLRERRPAVTEDALLALTPWMLAGAWLHVLYVVGAAPALLVPLLGTPAVYATVAVVAGGVWALADAGDLPVPATLSATGSVAAALPLVRAVGYGLERGSFDPVVPALALVASLVVGGGWWVLLRRWRPEISTTRRLGLLAVLGHALDGVSTAVGVALLGFGERTPLSRVIIEFGASLPTDLLGGTWLFVLVKLGVAGLVVWLLADYVAEDPVEGRLLLLLVAAVGLGPGAHNLLLFTIA